MLVPTDCLAAHLKRLLPTATRLQLGIRSLSRISHGTATTAVEKMGTGGAIRLDGKIVEVPSGWKTREMDFGKGPRRGISIPWGDVATAFYSTGIPNIEVYASLPMAAQRFIRISRYLKGILDSGLVQSFLKKQILKQPAGPNEAERKRGSTHIWGEVVDADGQRAEARLHGPEGYTFTMLTALAIVERVLEGNAPVGFQTPAKAYGPDWVLEIEHVKREEVALSS